ncbi:cytidine deaminase-like protein [Chytriomyces cf. hyalinus JEL632]|nr:cytidine deaminase-like protein [Chytriomyces cf. hyalinus JEL632]
MLICLVGPQCAGKRQVADYLVRRCSFTRIGIVGRAETADVSGLSNEFGLIQVDSEGDSSDTLVFKDATAALSYVTANWETHFVVQDLGGLAAHPSFNWSEWSKRPFVLLVSIHAPTLVRFSRSQSRPSADPSAMLQAFVAQDDHLNDLPLSTNLSLFKLMHQAHFTINNPFKSRDELLTVLEKSNLTDPNRTRPNWDLYFLKLCDLAASRSNCMKRRVGCVVTKDRRVVATGYNGTPAGLRNCNEGGCKRCNEGIARMGDGLEMCICLHAEENALLEAGRERISTGSKTILYCNTCPCVQCARKIIQLGINEVVYSQSYGMDSITIRLFGEAGIVMRQVVQMATCV